MRKDAEAHAADDKKRRELVDLKNQGDSMAYQMEKMLKDQGEKIPAGDRSNIEAAITNLRSALKGDDAASIKKAMENLEKSSHKVAEEMYKSAGGPAQAGPGPQQGPTEEKPAKGGKGDDDVIDADYEVKE
jgi:molecular chaperone DnaK